MTDQDDWRDGYGPRWRYNDPRFSEDVPGSGVEPTRAMIEGRWTGSWWNRLALWLRNLYV